MLPVQSFPPWRPGYSLSPFSRPVWVDVGRFRHGLIVPKGAWIIRTTSNVVEMATGAMEPGPPIPPPSPPTPCRCRPKCVDPNAQSVVETARLLGVGWPRPPRPPPPPPRTGPFYAYTRVRARTNEDVLQGRHWFPREIWSRQRMVLSGQFRTAPVVLSDGWNVRIIGPGRAMLMQAFSV